MAPRHCISAGMSLPGSPLATLPPMVPRARTCGSAMTRAVSRMIGMAAARSAAAISSAIVVVAPITKLSPSRLMPRSSAMPPRSTSACGTARRSFIIGIRLWPPASGLASSPRSASRATASLMEVWPVIGEWAWNHGRVLRFFGRRVRRCAAGTAQGTCGIAVAGAAATGHARAGGRGPAMHERRRFSHEKRQDAGGDV